MVKPTEKIAWIIIVDMVALLVLGLVIIILHLSEKVPSNLTPARLKTLATTSKQLISSDLKPYLNRHQDTIKIIASFLLR